MSKGVRVNHDDFFKYLKYGDPNEKYPSELRMTQCYPCCRCESFEMHEFLGFRTNRNEEDGLYTEEVWQCLNCKNAFFVKRK